MLTLYWTLEERDLMQRTLFGLSNHFARYVFGWYIGTTLNCKVIGKKNSENLTQPTQDHTEPGFQDPD